MDSLTHIAVGSAMGMAVMGSCTPRWKAALWGSVCATLPDLDVFLRHGDPIRNMTFHRGDSHALLYLTLLAPLIALIASRVHGQPLLFRRWWLMAWLALIFHPLLDFMTIYGTQLLRPFIDHPFGVGSIFIIDPLFTVPVLVGAVVALSWRSPRALRWNAAGLVLSAAYLAWTYGAQQYVTRIARDSLRAQRIDVQQIEVDPTVLNSVLWRVTAMTPTHYLEGFYSLFDDHPTIVFREYPRGAELYEKTRDDWHVARIAWFSHGFFSMEERDGKVLISDLRMGMEPNYNFKFAVFEERHGTLIAIPPEQLTMRPEVGRSVMWLWNRLLGNSEPGG
ncbi:MAG: metal-dependent hydrolase [Gammaproteobacteria bacterium]